jgi:hypothetical protein
METFFDTMDTFIWTSIELTVIPHPAISQNYNSNCRLSVQPVFQNSDPAGLSLNLTDLVCGNRTQFTEQLLES